MGLPYEKLTQILGNLATEHTPESETTPEFINGKFDELLFNDKYLYNQINVLKSVKTIYRDFAAVNESFNQYTPIEDVISAMADYSMLIATTYRPENIGIYPSASGELIITKSIINRTKVEFISYTGEQYIANNGDRFSGFKKVVTEDMLASMREQITATQEMLVNITSE